MKVRVIGKKHVKFTDANGKQVEFYKIFGTHKNPFSDDFTTYEGEGCSEISLPFEIWNDIRVDSDYLMEFNQNGKLTDYTDV